MLILIVSAKVIDKASINLAALTVVASSEEGLMRFYIDYWKHRDPAIRNSFSHLPMVEYKTVWDRIECSCHCNLICGTGRSKLTSVTATKYRLHTAYPKLYESNYDCILSSLYNRYLLSKLFVQCYSKILS